MKTYIKKPVKIEAVQLTADNVSEVAAWANSIQPVDKKVTIKYGADIVTDLVSLREVDGLVIPTKEGDMICSIGDYLIKEPFPTDDRMFYPCKADMFVLTYEEAK
jgi:hypothetical protein